jgi:hypothetical protein
MLVSSNTSWSTKDSSGFDLCHGGLKARGASAARFCTVTTELVLVGVCVGIMQVAVGTLGLYLHT